jgi:general secretion pathway protein I
MGVKRQRGFSLLEAIVALTIMASAGMALFAAMNQSLQMAQRAQQSHLADTAVRNALAWMETVNPGMEPEGNVRIGRMELHWRSMAVEPARDAMTGYLEAGLYRVGLYDVTLEIRTAEGVDTEFVLRKVGYVQVREPALL